MKAKNLIIVTIFSSIISFSLLSLFSFKSNTSAIQSSTDVPIGTIIIWSGNTSQRTPPLDKWKLCNGERLRINSFVELYAVIRHSWRIPSDPNFFYLPDLRGVFILIHA